MNEVNKKKLEDVSANNLADLFLATGIGISLGEDVPDPQSPIPFNFDNEPDSSEDIATWVKLLSLGTLAVDEIEPVLSAALFFRRNDFYILKKALSDREPVDPHSTISLLTNNCKSVAIITDESAFENTENYTLDVNKLSKMKVSALAQGSVQMEDYFIDNRFIYSWQPALKAAYGTCFFIGEARVMMTWHSLSIMLSKKRRDKNKEFYIIKNYSMEGARRRRNIEMVDIFKVNLDFNPVNINQRSDWAIVDVTPLIKDESNKENHFISIRELQPNENFSFKGYYCGMDTYCIGHGMNLPAKISLHGTLFKKMEHNMFKAKLETFPGNSGSPVFNAETHEIVGMVSGGDFLNIQLPNQRIMPLAQIGGLYGATCTCINSK